MFNQPPVFMATKWKPNIKIWRLVLYFLSLLAMETCKITSFYFIFIFSLSPVKKQGLETWQWFSSPKVLAKLFLTSIIASGRWDSFKPTTVASTREVRRSTALVLLVLEFWTSLFVGVCQAPFFFFFFSRLSQYWRAGFLLRILWGSQSGNYP